MKRYANQLLKPIVAKLDSICLEKFQAANYNNSPASWRRMLLYQPPIWSFDLMVDPVATQWIVDSSGRKTKTKCLVAKSPDPQRLRMSDLLRWCEIMLRSGDKPDAQKISEEYVRLENYRQLEEVAWI